MCKYMKIFKHKVNESLSDKCTLTFFTLRYQLIFKDPGTMLNVPRLPLLCLTLLKYIWEKKKGSF